jgi:glycosyltransferase involved in cell wall biosynthesis
VIPVHNGATTLGSCLEGLARQTVSALEVIVVDDGSTDDSAAVARRYGARVIRQECRGAAAARNRGIEAARADIILFTDADCRPEPDWAERMLAAFEDGPVAGCKGAYISHQNSLIARFVQLEHEARYARTRRFDSIDFVDTYSAGYRRSVLQEVGGFDERFVGASVEDQELSFRVAAGGSRLVFAPEARVEHRHVETLRAYWRKKFRIGYEKPMVHRRHRGKLLHDSHTPALLRVQTALAVVGLAASALSVARRSVSPAAALCAGAILLSSAPLAWRNLRRDRAVGAVTPILVAVRAAALGSGLVLGSTRGLCNEVITFRERQHGRAKTMPG